MVCAPHIHIHFFFLFFFLVVCGVVWMAWYQSSPEHTISRITLWPSPPPRHTHKISCAFRIYRPSLTLCTIATIDSTAAIYMRACCICNKINNDCVMYTLQETEQERQRARWGCRSLCLLTRLLLNRLKDSFSKYFYMYLPLKCICPSGCCVSLFHL